MAALMQVVAVDMWFLIEGVDAEGSLDDRVTHRSVHRERLLALRDEARLLLAGPLPAIDSEEPGPAGFVGSIVVAEFETRAAAERWARDDIYLQTGVWRDVSVRSLIKALP